MIPVQIRTLVEAVDAIGGQNPTQHETRQDVLFAGDHPIFAVGFSNDSLPNGLRPGGVGEQFVDEDMRAIHDDPIDLVDVHALELLCWECVEHVVEFAAENAAEGFDDHLGREYPFEEDELGA